tara:strand:+ start:504 stop:836 length:333 start_codon:yes stop_codon:yes gene_type:complete
MKTTKQRLMELAAVNNPFVNEAQKWNPDDTIIMTMEVTIEEIMQALQVAGLQVNPDMIASPNSINTFEKALAEALTTHVKKGTRLSIMLSNMWKEGVFKGPQGEMVIRKY